MRILFIGSRLYDDVDYYVTHSIDNNIYTIYANKDVLGVQLGGLNGFEIYKLSTGLLRYEKVWSSIRIFPEEIPSSVLKTVKNKDEIIEVVYNPMGYECEIIDVDAYTGGFNLQIAFSTGYLAGKSAAEIY